MLSFIMILSSTWYHYKQNNLASIAHLYNVYMLHVHVVLCVFIVTNGANSFLLFWLQHVSFQYTLIILVLFM